MALAGVAGVAAKAVAVKANGMAKSAAVRLPKRRCCIDTDRTKCPAPAAFRGTLSVLLDSLVRHERPG